VPGATTYMQQNHYNSCFRVNYGDTNEQFTDDNFQTNVHGS